MLSFYSKTGAKTALLGSFGWQEWSEFGQAAGGDRFEQPDEPHDRPAVFRYMACRDGDAARCR